MNRILMKFPPFCYTLIFVLLLLPDRVSAEILFDLENSPERFFGSGDQNGDGFNDLIVFDDNTNRLLVFWGGTTLDTVPDVIVTDVFPDSITAVAEGYIFNALGDVNGDGILDFSIKAGSQMGSWLYIYYGGNPPVFSNIIDSIQNLFSVGDLNTDGYDDILSINSYSYWDGAARICFGGDSLDLIADWTAHFEVNEWRYIGGNIWQYNLYSVLRDMNGDGIDDFVLGLRNHARSLSRSVVYWGGVVFDTMPDIDTTFSLNNRSNFIIPVGDVWQTGYSAVSMWSMDTTLQIWSSVQNLDSLPDAILLPDEYNQYGIYMPKYAGDVNGDGYDDLVTPDPDGGFGGQIVIYITGPDFDELPDVVIDGMGLGWLFDVGRYFSWVGDMNGDGCDDLCFSVSNSSSSSVIRLLIVAGDSTWHTNHIPRIVDWSPRDSLIYAAPGDTLNFFLDVQDRDTNQQLFYTWHAGQPHASPFNPEYSHSNPFTTIISDTIIQASTFIRVDVWDGYVERTHFWQVTIDTAYTGIRRNNQQHPDIFHVGKPYPNPFNDSIALDYSLPNPASVEVVIYDLTGRLVRQWVREHQIPGEYRLVWTGTDEQNQPVGSGIYLIRIRMGEKKNFIRKISLIK